MLLPEGEDSAFSVTVRGLDTFIEKEAPAEDADVYRYRNMSDRKAKAIIGLSQSDEHLEHVSGVATAKEMWQSLLNSFERHTLLNKLAARRNFYTVTMYENEQIITYVNRIRQLASTLKSMGVEIDDKELAMAVLKGLPERFDSLICALDALENKNDTPLWTS